MKPLSVIYDNNFVRYRLVKTNPANTNPHDWVFLPGGPGADSSYYMTLIDHLDDLGNCWLMDFPANGDNIPNADSSDFDFNLWLNYFIPAIQRFNKPILVGQSFGGMLPLLFPELEKILSGFVIFNSAPKLWFTEAINHAKENNITNTSDVGIKFRENPTQETFAAALLANAHCHFPEKSIKAGMKMFTQLPFNFEAMLWWFKKIHEIHFDAKWIPQTVPILIMGGRQDFVVPCSVFETDARFHRNNIEMMSLQNAGHFLWFDQMEIVKNALNRFLRRVDL